uniref:Uncharacterized protein n=1 Tax=Phaeomonas parva TaxID=124430 RepID=A0A7S1UEG3_9STRA|mmetsp:Transcript_43953/g.138153  ORF Transcript_43953/g.138153 Transcript_43953/m.138153 type:complete len:1143 (+) Transcript_43953:216-3644(+)
MDLNNLETEDAIAAIAFVSAVERRAFEETRHHPRVKDVLNSLWTSTVADGYEGVHAFGYQRLHALINAALAPEAENEVLFQEAQQDWDECIRDAGGTLTLSYDDFALALFRLSRKLGGGSTSDAFADFLDFLQALALGSTTDEQVEAAQERFAYSAGVEGNSSYRSYSRGSETYSTGVDDEDTIPSYLSMDMASRGTTPIQAQLHTPESAYIERVLASARQRPPTGQRPDLPMTTPKSRSTSYSDFSRALNRSQNTRTRGKIIAPGRLHTSFQPALSAPLVTSVQHAGGDGSGPPRAKTRENVVFIPGIPSRPGSRQKTAAADQRIKPIKVQATVRRHDVQQPSTADAAAAREAKAAKRGVSFEDLRARTMNIDRAVNLWFKEQQKIGLPKGVRLRKDLQKVANPGLNSVLIACKQVGMEAKPGSRKKTRRRKRVRRREQNATITLPTEPSKIEAMYKVASEETPRDWVAQVEATLDIPTPQSERKALPLIRKQVTSGAQRLERSLSHTLLKPPSGLEGVARHVAAGIGPRLNRAALPNYQSEALLSEHQKEQSREALLKYKTASGVLSRPLENPDFANIMKQHVDRSLPAARSNGDAQELVADAAVLAQVVEQERLRREAEAQFLQGVEAKSPSKQATQAPLDLDSGPSSIPKDIPVASPKNLEMVPKDVPLRESPSLEDYVRSNENSSKLPRTSLSLHFEALGAPMPSTPQSGSGSGRRRLRSSEQQRRRLLSAERTRTDSLDMEEVAKPRSPTVTVLRISRNNVSDDRTLELPQPRAPTQLTLGSSPSPEGSLGAPEGGGSFVRFEDLDMPRADRQRRPWSMPATNPCPRPMPLANPAGVMGQEAQTQGEQETLPLRNPDSRSPLPTPAADARPSTAVELTDHGKRQHLIGAISGGLGTLRQPQYPATPELYSRDMLARINSALASGFDAESTNVASFAPTMDSIDKLADPKEVLVIGGTSGATIHGRMNGKLVTGKLSTNHAPPAGHDVLGAKAKELEAGGGASFLEPQRAELHSPRLTSDAKLKRIERMNHMLKMTKERAEKNASASAKRQMLKMKDLETKTRPPSWVAVGGGVALIRGTAPPIFAETLPMQKAHVGNDLDEAADVKRTAKTKDRNIKVFKGVSVFVREEDASVSLG